METVPPNTIIHLPPVHRRTVSETGLLLFVGIIAPLIILWMLFRVTAAPVAVANSTPRPAAAVETPPVVVEVVMQFPTATPQDTPSASWMPSPTATSDWCDARFTQPGAACTKPFPPPPTPTPLLSCDDETVDSGDLCRWSEPASASEMWGLANHDQNEPR
ncbi:MAG: hypothetical protein ACJ789_21485 [Thermomicrobiales bacterium]